MPSRPKRIRIADEIGRMQTLASGPEAFERLGPEGPVLFLGLGPEPGLLPRWFPEAGGDVCYVESPSMFVSMGMEWSRAVPPHFVRLDPARIPDDFLQHGRVIRHIQSGRLFSSFWGPVWGRLSSRLLGPAAGDQTVWIPCGEGALLADELCAAFESHGFTARRVPENASALAGLLRQERPSHYLSVNFRGLDPYGEAVHLLKACGAKVAVWCVDNPFHLLTAVKSLYWTNLPLFVTDVSFVGPLRAHGAERVEHLPLAACPGFARPGPAPSHANGLSDRLVFVGRSEFPGRAGFFSGCHAPGDMLAQAGKMAEHGERPDFHWWCEKMGLKTLWPGNEVRRAGYGAEVSGLDFKTACLRHAGKDVTVFGDAGWAAFLGPGADIRGPVDYYNGLAGLYRAAGVSLNASGLLLPAGLSQRHFDVWLAGGFLVTDRNPGLDIFPEDLWRPVSFRKPAELPALFRRFRYDSRERRELAASWHALILSRHTYGRRVGRLLDLLG